MASSGTSFEEFVSAARAVVEEQAREHADDRWWILEPLLLVERRALHAAPLAEAPDALRALRTAGPPALPEALDARRAAIALHVDLGVGGAVVPAVVLVVVTPLLHAVQVARVERTDAGTPRLGPWGPSDLADEDVAAALRRLAAG
ncbi:MAG TPA: hypothetical protein VLB47_13380 [Solirubrobacteraceae bacterium]|nr:hypothetical protein [Solirubrobacteraceae bacterium]